MPDADSQVSGAALRALQDARAGMDVKQPLQYCKQIAIAAGLAAITASGCAGNIVSRRNLHEPACGAEVVDDLTMPRRGFPVAVWPTISGVKMPRCLTRAGSAQLNEDFTDFLQPQPPAPLKPPHSRFHPLPTQPVFAQRAEYSPPEVLGAQANALPGELLDAPHAEEIPIPVPEPLPPEVEANDRMLRQPPSVMPDSTPEAPPQARPIETPPPQLQPPTNDASRGSIAPASFTFTTEPNPLRPAARTASTHVHR